MQAPAPKQQKEPAVQAWPVILQVTQTRPEKQPWFGPQGPLWQAQFDPAWAGVGATMLFMSGAAPSAPLGGHECRCHPKLRQRQQHATGAGQAAADPEAEKSPSRSSTVEQLGDSRDREDRGQPV